MIKVYVVYTDFGYDGCMPPEKVFTTMTKARQYRKQTFQRFEKICIKEMELE